MMTLYGMMTIYGNGNGIPGDFLPLPHSVSILSQLKQLREHWRSLFQITLTLVIVVRIKDTMMVKRMIVIARRKSMIVRRMIMMVWSTNSMLEPLFQILILHLGFLIF